MGLVVLNALDTFLPCAVNREGLGLRTRVVTTCCCIEQLAAFVLVVVAVGLCDPAMAGSTPIATSKFAADAVVASLRNELRMAFLFCATERY
jgi:hypothetical protein